MTTVALSIEDRKVYALFIAQGLAKHTFPAEEKRLARAAEIVLNGHCHMQPDGSALVEATCHSGMQYTVTQHGCTCVDTQHNDVPGQRCKHVLARAFCRCIARLMTTQHYAIDTKDDAAGIATQVEIQGERGWVFQAFTAPLPHAVPEARLVLCGQCNPVVFPGEAA